MVKIPYQQYDWNTLIKIRDAYQVLNDVLSVKDVAWVENDERLVQVSDEIDRRYKLNNREG